ncbi:MAG: secretin N-terminal domain-containing protein [Armatimonadota bacterium]
MRLKYLIIVFLLLFAFSVNIALPDETPDGLPYKIFKLKYIKAKEVVPIIKMFMSKDGRIVPDERLNSIIVADHEKNLIKIQEYLDKNDTALPNVMVNAKIVSEEELSRTGILINWQLTNNYWRAAFLGPGNYNFENSLEATLLVMSRHEGKITIGRDVPYPHWFYVYTQNQGYIPATTVKFYNVDSGIVVTPRVIEGTDEVELTVFPFISYQADNNIPGVVKYGEIQTVIKVKNGQSVVLGGSNQGKDNIVSTVLNGSMKEKGKSNFVVVLTATIK